MGHNKLKKHKKISPSKQNSTPSKSKLGLNFSVLAAPSPAVVPLAGYQAITTPISPSQVQDGSSIDLAKNSVTISVPNVTEIASPVADLEQMVTQSSAEEVKDNEAAPTLVDAAELAGQVADKANTSARPADSWCSLVKGTTKPLRKKGKAFTLESGEACVMIPNYVIERNKSSWDCFVLGQFYSDPPSQGTLHSIVNGIWSKQYRDISVSKMEGHSFLFRIPNRITRDRVITQRLWQIQGQTLFVAKWEPGLVQAKPELASAPIWLELRKVPFQFFHEEGLERIAGLVGDPKFLHPLTANKTNLEVAKVFTIIDPRKPLPEAVNVQFESGEICRVLVSSPWMPPICEHCKEVGHSIKRCKLVPKSCKECQSSEHEANNCPTANRPLHKGKKTRCGRSKSKVWAEKPQAKNPTSSVQVLPPSQSSLGNVKDFAAGETSRPIQRDNPPDPDPDLVVSKSISSSEAEVDSSDVSCSDMEEEEYGELLDGNSRGSTSRLNGKLLLDVYCLQEVAIA
ncbi:hypothetical protein AALP_AAs74350U000100 [Arabis alpina]|uniref:DUF4283 domain-containing protein n=1 Tax=Arabis alpina TaxID=50452 RepID=A0A087G3E7_ARAAL|nr:hypothetical protein AALP_AAs74350U000100 [Arabis alpina]